MKCMNCTADIPPQWKAAISKNICPSCDGQIMSNEDQGLLTELKEAMEKMPNDPEGLAGWLLSNYSLRKVGSAEPTEFFIKKNEKGASHQGLKIADNPMQKFLKRAGVAKDVQQRNSFKQIVEEIQSGSIDESLYGNNEFEEDFEQEFEDEDPYEAAENARQQFKSRAKHKVKNALVLPGQAGGASLSQEEIMEISENLNGGVHEEQMHPALQRARMLRLKKQDDIARGGGEGPFRRG